MNPVRLEPTASRSGSLVDLKLQNGYFCKRQRTGYNVAKCGISFTQSAASGMTNSIFREKYSFAENITCGPSRYLIDRPDITL